MVIRYLLWLVRILKAYVVLEFDTFQANLLLYKVKSISVMTITDTEFINHVIENLEKYVDEVRPVQQGNTLVLPDGMTQVKVIRVEPHPYGIVTEDTVIHCTTGLVEVEKGNFNKVRFHGSYRMRMAWVRSLLHRLQKPKS